MSSGRNGFDTKGAYREGRRLGKGYAEGDIGPEKFLKKVIDSISLAQTPDHQEDFLRGVLDAAGKRPYTRALKERGRKDGTRTSR